jgi:hypothetical protein
VGSQEGTVAKEVSYPVFVYFGDLAHSSLSITENTAVLKIPCTPGVFSFVRIHQGATVARSSSTIPDTGHSFAGSQASHTRYIEYWCR